MVSDSHGFITKLLARSSEPQALDYYDGIVDVLSNSASHERITNTGKPSLSRSQQNRDRFPTSPLGRQKNAASTFPVHSSLDLSGVQKPLPLHIQY